MSEPAGGPDSEAAAEEDEPGRPSRTRQLGGWFLGPSRLAPLTITHCVHSAAEVLLV